MGTYVGLVKQFGDVFSLAEMNAMRAASNLNTKKKM
jgi:hypothetical protein